MTDLMKKGEKQTDGELKLILPYPPSVNNLYATFRTRLPAISSRR